MAPSASASIERAVSPASRPRLLPRPQLLLRLLHAMLVLAIPSCALCLYLLHAQHLSNNGPLLLSEAPHEQAIVVALLLFVSAGLAHWLLRRRYQRFFRSAGKALAALGEKPSLAATQAVAHSGADVDAETLLRPLAHVADCYRQALEKVVMLKALLEAVNPGSTPATGLSSGSRPPTFPFERSRQQMVARLTPNLRWQSATPLLQQVMGRSIERLNGRPFLRFVHPDDRERVKKILTDTLKEGESHNLVFRALPPSPSGEEPPADAAPEVLDALPLLYLQADVLVYLDREGVPEQLRCHFVNVTERILAEQELRRRTAELVKANERLQRINRDLERLKESYRDLYHHAPVMYFSLDDRGRFAAINETMLGVIGYRREEILGQPYYLLLPAAARETHRQDPEALRRPGEVESHWISKDGRQRDVWIGTTTIKDEEGLVIRSRCAAADITERNLLAQAVVGRARDLEQANTELRRINQELEEFTYVVSHDLKEPLRTLEAFSSFLSSDYSDRLDEDGRDYISHLIAASRRLGKLIDDLLTLSRAGRVIGTPRPLDWETIINTILADLQLLITRRPGCIIRVEGKLPAVQGDPERISQLLANLVSNALKYNESLTPEVVIGATTDNGRFATLFVRDNGMGIDSRYHDQIFRIFRRLHRQDEFEGTGAGLAICKKVVEAHGGKLWVESAPGEGSTFFFTLPRASEQPKEAENATVAPPGR
jgi:PAS domain S-box-containing protein